MSECVVHALCTVYNRCDTCHLDGYRRWSPRRMRLVRHGRRTQRRAGPQTRWSRGYTAWHGSGRSVGRLSVCRRRTAISLSLSLSVSPYRSIDLSTHLSLSFANKYIIYIRTYIYIVFFLRLCHLSRSFTHTLTHAREFSNKEVYILLYYVYIRSGQPFFTHAHNIR